MALSDRQKRILLMSLSYMHKYGEPFVDLVKGDPEANKKAWGKLRDEIKELHSQLARKFNQ